MIEKEIPAIIESIDNKIEKMEKSRDYLNNLSKNQTQVLAEQLNLLIDKFHQSEIKTSKFEEGLIEKIISQIEETC